MGSPPEARRRAPRNPYARVFNHLSNTAKRPSKVANAVVTLLLIGSISGFFLGLSALNYYSWGDDYESMDLAAGLTPVNLAISASNKLAAAMDGYSTIECDVPTQLCHITNLHIISNQIHVFLLPGQIEPYLLNNISVKTGNLL